MAQLSTFTIISVDGFFAGPHGEIDWFKDNDEEDRRFSQEHADASAAFIFGRTTYELMSQFWPTPEAAKMDPVTAKALCTTPKIVFSKTMGPVEDGPVWKNVTVRRDIVRDEILRLKGEVEGPITILGSGSIVRQLANLGLIDEYGLMVVPVILGAGKYLFKDVNRMNLKLVETRAFRNGKVFLKYRPALDIFVQTL
jgi:dihydrofolate reductase